MASELSIGSFLTAEQAADKYTLTQLAKLINDGFERGIVRLRTMAIDIVQRGSYLVAAKSKCNHGEWLPWLKENCPEISEDTAERYAKTYKAYSAQMRNLDSILPSEAYRLLGVIKESSDNIHFSSNSNEWTTPQEILDLVEKALGGIDLDPCSDSEKNVPAKEHFTQVDNGLEREWDGNVYMNPPYGGEIGEWVEKLKDEYASGRVKKAVALVPARTDTDWFYAWRDYPKCFIRHRLKFGGQENSAPFPSMLVYFGKEIGKFIEATKDIGDVYVRIEQ